MSWIVIFVFPLIPLLIIDVCEDIELSITTQIAIAAFMLLCFVGLIVSFWVFKRAMFGFSELLAEKIYFLVCTMKGKAICRHDFKVIKKVKENLYFYIATQMCRGYCYSGCFEICKTLKKGSIEFIAVKELSSHEAEEDDGKDYTLHCLYLNDGWAFDTFSSRQYPIKKLHEIYKAKIYKIFSFDEICSKSYEEFIEEQESKLVEWCRENDCSIFLE